MKRFLLPIYLLTLLACTARGQAKLKAFPLQAVKLLPGMFQDAEYTDLHYMMALNPDRLLAPYLREAGLNPKAQSYTNWENTGLDGHIGGHYLSALAMMYASTGDKQMLARLEYMIGELKRCQNANGNGYVGGVPGSKALWAEVMTGNLTSFKKKWVPLYNIHKTIAGIRDAYLYAGNQTAKTMLIKFADWFVALSTALTPQKMQEMLQTEHGGVNEVLADVYALTGDKKYLTAAYSFSHQAVLQPLEKDQDRLNNLHANTQIPKIIGFKRIADLSGDTAYNHAAQFFWQTVTTRRSVAIGGNSVREHFNPANDFSSMMTSEQGPETCNSYNMLKLTEALFLAEPKGRYMDFYERALYNHILSTEHSGRGGFVYFTPIRAGHYRVYSQPETSMWCCVGSGMENHAKYGEMIYAHSNDQLYVNLFIPSQLKWKEKGLTITQCNKFPEQESTSFIVNSVGKGALDINIRYPAWVKTGAMKISINGKPAPCNQVAGYVKIKRAWKKDDVINISLPMQTTTEQLPDGSNYEAVLHGPIVLAAIIDTTKLTGLFADDSRMGHVAAGKQFPLQDMPMFVSNTKDDASKIVPIPGMPMTYSAENLVYPAKYNSLKLIPFYKIHDARYAIYFQKETPGGLAAIQKKMAADEAAAEKLTAITIDMVRAGEQQPEADHFVESENSNTGVNQDRHWRDARGWFSYKLSDKNKQAASLRITYFGGDRGRKFSILVNGQELSKVTLDGNHGNDFYTVDYPLPKQLVQASNGTLIVKMQATEGSVAGGIYEVRLLK